MTQDREIAVVTGGAQGIGLAIVRRLARDGLHVHAVDRSEQRLVQAMTSLREEGLDVSWRALDVTDETAMVDAFDSLSRVDVVVACAGVISVSPVEELSVAEFRRVVDVNLTGTFITIREAVRRMKEGGRIVAVASRSILGDRNLSHYIASKAGIVGLVRAIAAETRYRLIAVNAVAPGAVDTEMVQVLGGERLAEELKKEPRGRASDPAEIAHAVSFLASPQTRFITGQTLFVDGGKSLGGLSAAV